MESSTFHDSPQDRPRKRKFEVFQEQHDESTSCRTPPWRLENRSSQNHSMVKSEVSTSWASNDDGYTPAMQPPPTPRPRHAEIPFEAVRNADQANIVRGVGLYAQRTSQANEMPMLNSGVDEDVILSKQEAEILELQEYEHQHPEYSLGHEDTDDPPANGLQSYTPGRWYLGDSWEEDQELLALAMSPDSPYPPGIVADKHGRFLQYDREIYGAWRDIVDQGSAPSAERAQVAAVKMLQTTREIRRQSRLEYMSLPTMGIDPE